MTERKPMERPAEFELYTEHGMKVIALLLGVNCVRNTIIEEYHAGDENTSQISNEEMKAFNVQVVDRLYTALCNIFLGEPEDRMEFVNLLMWYWPHNWYEPQKCQELDEAVTKFKDILMKAYDDADEG